MPINLKTVIICSVIFFLIVVGSILMVKSGNTPSKYDDFANCLTEKDAKFYGAFWCPHCKDQKNLFGKSSKYLPYIECSTPDGNNQLAVCSEKDIESYPTWIFANGSIEKSKLTLEKLAEKTNCQLP